MSKDKKFVKVNIESEQDLKSLLETMSDAGEDQETNLIVRRLTPKHLATVRWFEIYKSMHDKPDPYELDDEDAKDPDKLSLPEHSIPETGDLCLFGADVRPLYGIVLGKDKDKWKILPLSYIDWPVNDKEQMFGAGAFKGAWQVWNVRTISDDVLANSTPVTTFDEMDKMNHIVEAIARGDKTLEGIKDMRGIDKLYAEEAMIDEARDAYMASEKALWDAALV